MKTHRPDTAAAREVLRGAQIFVLPYNHADWAWTCTRRWHEERYTTSLVQTLDLMREIPELTAYVDTWNEQLEPILRRIPERLPEIRKRVSEGRLAIAGGTICNPHSDRIGGESYVRNLVLGRRMFRRLFPGVDLSVLVFNDVIFGHAQTPQLALLGGYRYYRAYRPQHALNVKGVPTAFRWRGSDGSEILTSRGHYGILYHTGEIPSDPSSDWETTADRFYGPGVMDQVGPGRPPVVAIGFGCDDALPLRDIRDRPVALPALLREWNRREPSRMKFGTPQEYCRALEPYRDSLPVHRGVVDPIGWSYWFGQLGNLSLRSLRVCADLELTSAEFWCAAASVTGRRYPASSIDDVWMRLLKTSPHAVLWLFEEDYAELLRDVDRVRAASADLARDARAALMPRQGTYRRCAAWVRSDLPWSRTSWVRLRHVVPERGTRILRAAGADGRRLPVFAHNLRCYEDGTIKEADLWVRVRSEGAGMFPIEIRESARAPGRRGRALQRRGRAMPNEVRNTDWPCDRADVASNATIRLGDVEIEFLRGHISRLRRAGKTGAAELGGRVCDIVFHEIEDTGPYHYGPVVRTIRCRSAVAHQVDRFTVERRGRLGEHTFRQRLTALPGDPLVEVETEIDCAGGDGFFRLEIPLPFDPVLSADSPWGIEPRDLDDEPREGEERLRRHTFWGWSFATARGKKAGLTLFGPVGVHGYFYDPHQRLFGHVLLKAIRHPAQDWEKFETRLREGRGRHVCRSWILPHGPRPSAAGLVRRAWELRRPAVAEAGALCPDGDGAEGRLPEEAPVLALESRSAVLTALYREAGEIVVRLYDAGGRGDRGVLRFGRPADAVRKTDFNGSDLRRGAAPLRAADGSIRFQLAPAEIATFRLRFGKTGKSSRSRLRSRERGSGVPGRRGAQRSE